MSTDLTGSAETTQAFETPAQRWGVDSGEAGMCFCDLSALRGGVVNAIPCHNAAMAVFESLENSRRL